MECLLTFVVALLELSFTQRANARVTGDQPCDRFPSSCFHCSDYSRPGTQTHRPGPNQSSLPIHRYNFCREIPVRDLTRFDLHDGFCGPGPYIVYQLRNRQPVGSPHYSSAIVTLIPSAYYPSMDFEIFACQLKYGNVAENCALEADNVDRPGQSFQLAIPNQYVTYRIVVSAGNELESGYVPCVPFTLVVQRLQQETRPL